MTEGAADPKALARRELEKAKAKLEERVSADLAEINRLDVALRALDPSKPLSAQRGPMPKVSNERLISLRSQGLSNRSIAKAVGVSPPTVSTRFKQMLNDGVEVPDAVRQAKYPWDKWLDGSIWQIWRERDYQTQTKSFMQHARNTAADKGLRLRLEQIREDKQEGVVLQAFEGEDG